MNRLQTLLERLRTRLWSDFVPEKDLIPLMRFVRWVNAGDWQSQPLDFER